MVGLKPCGPGNWATLTMHLDGKRADPVLMAVGAVIQMMGIDWRVCWVKP